MWFCFDTKSISVPSVSPFSPVWGPIKATILPALKLGCRGENLGNEVEWLKGTLTLMILMTEKFKMCNKVTMHLHSGRISLEMLATRYFIKYLVMCFWISANHLKFSAVPVDLYCVYIKSQQLTFVCWPAYQPHLVNSQHSLTWLVWQPFRYLIYA